MIRQENTIGELKENIVNGWRPLYATFDEDEEANPLPIVKVDFVCEWRLDDGKLKFVEVPYETPEELQEIITALEESVPVLTAAILENFAKLKNSDE